MQILFGVDFNSNRRIRGSFPDFPIGSAAVNLGRTLFSQLMDFVPWTSFGCLVKKYGGDVRVRKFRCTEQFCAMAFAQLTFRESLRDIEAWTTAFSMPASSNQSNLFES
jgi:hypothetical protein